MITAIKDELNETIRIDVTSPDGKFRRFRKKEGENTNKFIRRVSSGIRQAEKKFKNSAIPESANKDVNI